MKQNTTNTYKLGIFVIAGLSLFLITIYLIGKSQNLFGGTVAIKAKFNNVSGLKVGNNVRFSGIDIGSVENIEFETDSTVIVGVVIQKEVQKFIKTDAMASIGSDGLMGDKVLTISPGSNSNTIIKDNSFLKSSKAVEIEDIMKSVKLSADNAGIITNELAMFTNKMNNNNGALSKLMTDASFANSLTNTLSNLENSSSNFSTFTTKMNNKNGILSKLVNDKKLGQSLDSTIKNLETGTKEINETVKAAQNNFLLKGYFNKKKRAAAKKKEAAEKASQK